MVEQLDDVDFALAAFRRDGAWVVDELAHDLPGEVEALAEALRRFSGDDLVVALLGLDEESFLVLRVDPDRTRLLLWDAAAAEEWDVAASALDFLGLADDEGDDDGDLVGDLDLLADLGLSGEELEDILDDSDGFADEVLSEVTRVLGFGPQFDDAVGFVPA
ncbi:tRNA adenosine deaminase-associated protein [Nocardioides litoris]|uniref:tRNA adenosine deaminase-associated protein n=1 Tax=Nocardioides litoris TaxID=1926648 RepID=UPI001120FBDF|nr:tRNA adenosine deaminase-associated protein [Nocardioides litoris]